MKKLSFLLALVLIFSSIAVVPVFAATDSTVTVVDDYSASTIKFESYSDVSSTGLTGITSKNSPLNRADNDVFLVSGTVNYVSTKDNTLANSSWRIGHDIKSVVNKNGTNYDTFSGNPYNAVSLNVYVDNTDTSIFPVVLRFGACCSPNIFAFSTIEKPSDEDIKTRFATTGYNIGTTTYMYFGFEKGKWNNITITCNKVDSNMVYTAYLNGIKITEFYDRNAKKYETVSKTYDVTTNAKTASLVTTSMVNGEFHKFYFDDLKQITSNNEAYTPDAPATIATAENGVVKVKTDVTLNGIKALATGANAVEVYRANSQTTTGYDAITENFATGDIVKLVTSNGSYNYYTLNVTATEEPEPEPENPFIIGDLTSDLDVSDGSVSATLELSGDTADKDVTLVVCLYKGITLVEMLTDTISNGDEVKNLSKSITVPTEAGNYTAKAFVWDSLNSMNMLK